MDHDHPAARPGAFSRKVLTGAGIVLGLLALALFLWYALDVLLVVFAGVLLGVFFRSLADWVSQLTGIPVRWSLAIVMVMLVGLLAGAGWLVVPQIVGQADQFS